MRGGAPWRYSRGGAAIAQLVEHLIRNEGVGGSNPSCGTNNINSLLENHAAVWSNKQSCRHPVAAVWVMKAAQRFVQLGRGLIKTQP
jgi:hypothetical protein